jgi:hypothetical protein
MAEQTCLTCHFFEPNPHHGTQGMCAFRLPPWVKTEYTPITYAYKVCDFWRLDAETEMTEEEYTAIHGWFK